ncbi:MAG TPA: O-antigen ligase family protein [Pirellulales bacterium]
MWLLAVVLILAWTLWKTFTVGRRYALGSAVALSLLVPNWVEVWLGPLWFDMRVTTAAIALSIYCLHPRTRWHGPLVAADWALVGLMAVHVASDTVNDGFQWTTLLRTYGEWGIAYVAGRLAIQEIGDLRRLAPLVCLVGMLLAGWAVFEAVTHVNPADVVFGQRPPEMFPRSVVRLGLKRAEGPVRHPIFFGMLQLLLWPWSLEAAAQSTAGRRPRWWRAAPWVSAVGILATVSRGPTLALGAACYLVALGSRPAWRRPLLAAGAVAALLLFVGRHQIIDVLHVLSQEHKLGSEARVVVDGQEIPYTGTMHRVLLWRVYAKAMQRAGWIGFGTDRTAGFPIRVPFGPEDTQTLKYLQFIDNEYILLDLRLGRLGVIGFVCLIAAPAIYLLLLGRPGHECRLFCLGLAAVMMSVMLELFTVWLPHDFGFVLFWSCGVGAGLWSDARRRFANPALARAGQSLRNPRIDGPQHA